MYSAMRFCLDKQHVDLQMEPQVSQLLDLCLQDDI